MKKLCEFSTVWADGVVFGSTEISAVKAKVCYFCGCFNVSMGMKIKKTELGQNRLLKHLQSIVDEKEELPCLLYLIQIFAKR